MKTKHENYPLANSDAIEASKQNLRNTVFTIIEPSNTAIREFTGRVASLVQIMFYHLFLFTLYKADCRDKQTPCFKNVPMILPS